MKKKIENKQMKLMHANSNSKEAYLGAFIDICMTDFINRMFS